MSEILVVIDEAKLRKLVFEHLADKIGYNFKTEDIKIETKLILDAINNY